MKNVWDHWKTEILTNEGHLDAIYVMHLPLLAAAYTRDVVIMGDTSYTNYYGKPLLFLICENENAYNQLLYYDILDDRSK